ncbi:pol polyprotein [Pseudoloma neurophilia]|uniref:Pol polyprotein n=1 Tax=Pseudoloma neurophilia TaxID=146866 RepID=A0A0R0M3Z5_9MICR|nr:pol polyprotein [Pseudoloma neurophilia]
MYNCESKYKCLNAILMYRYKNVRDFCELRMSLSLLLNMPFQWVIISLKIIQLFYLAVLLRIHSLHQMHHNIVELVNFIMGHLHTL